ncbi:hypothetical protein AK812_SmicGene22912 [Symbiodinium microadriaticum]|uniref:Uncharacterized protein n=1 Tax=Symbiodinium microadriaticum TaxID=2951 RepID=A0A1Q9DIL2_SYMMI|nr:hypothetical protein AK812_SmicGene22912 [Symbiodinium microadriaticum]
MWERFGSSLTLQAEAAEWLRVSLSVQRSPACAMSTACASWNVLYSDCWTEAESCNNPDGGRARRGPDVFDRFADFSASPQCESLWQERRSSSVTTHRQVLMLPKTDPATRNLSESTKSAPEYAAVMAPRGNLTGTVCKQACH